MWECAHCGCKAVTPGIPFCPNCYLPKEEAMPRSVAGSEPSNRFEATEPEVAEEVATAPEDAPADASAPAQAEPESESEPEPDPDPAAGTDVKPEAASASTTPAAARKTSPEPRPH